MKKICFGILCTTIILLSTGCKSSKLSSQTESIDKNPSSTSQTESVDENPSSTSQTESIDKNPSSTSQTESIDENSDFSSQIEDIGLIASDIEILHSSRVYSDTSAEIKINAERSEAVKYRATSRYGYINGSSHSFYGSIDDTILYTIEKDFEEDTIELEFYNQYGEIFEERKIVVFKHSEDEYYSLNEMGKV